MEDSKDKTTNSHKELRKKERMMGNNTAEAFDNKNIANLSDDPVGVLGWKGTGILLMMIIIGFSVYQVLK